MSGSFRESQSGYSKHILFCCIGFCQVGVISGCIDLYVRLPSVVVSSVSISKSFLASLMTASSLATVWLLDVVMTLVESLVCIGQLCD